MKKRTTVYKTIDNKDRRRRFERRHILFILFAFAMVSTLSFFLTRDTKDTVAVDLSGFKAGNIISDAVMRNYTSMNEAEIQNFLRGKNSCNKATSSVNNLKGISAGKDNGVPYNFQYNYGGKTYHYHVESNKFICMANEKFDGETVAHIIYQAAQDYKINPQVLIVLLEKEQGLVTDQWPNTNYQYRSATGYGCPDTAACDSKYYGMKNQVRQAASLFDTVLSGGWTNYPLGWNNIRYSPNSACGSSKVYVENLATSALYRYTPYQPNAAALKAGYGAGDGCSAYGNRNFYGLFTDWFGSTQTVRYTFAQNYYNSNKNTTGKLTGETKCLDANGKEVLISGDGTYYCSADFEKGTLFWTSEVKNNVKTDKDSVYYPKAQAEIYKKLSLSQRTDKIYITWLSNPSIGTTAKSVTAFEKDKNLRILQADNGVILGSDKTGYFAYKNSAYNAIVKNYELLGNATSGWNTNTKTGIEWYVFKNGYIVGNDKRGWFVSVGKIRSIWTGSGCESGSLGFPKSDIITDTGLGIKYQQYTGGIVVGTDEKGYRIIDEKAFEKWKTYYKDLGAQVANLGRNTKTGIEWYQFEKGYLVGHSKVGWFISVGKIRSVWSSLKFESGWLGSPSSDIITDAEKDLTYQTYANGAIIGNDKIGYFAVNKKVYSKMMNNYGILGKIITNKKSNPKTGIEWYQFEKGYIVGNDKKGWFLSTGGSRAVWAMRGYESGVLGYPTSDFNSNAKTQMRWQNYTGGVIVGNDEKGWFESRGKIRTKWAAAGYESGRYGFPTSNIVNGCQSYEGGKICEK